MESYPVLGATTPTRGEPFGAAEPPRGRRFPLRLMGLGLVILVGSALAAGVALNPLTRAAPEAVPTTNSQRLDQRAVAVAYVDVIGGVRSLSPTQPGRVKALPVTEGKEVPQGTVLLQLDDDLPRANLARAEYDLDAAQERLLEAIKLNDTRTRQIEGQALSIEAARQKLRSSELQAKKAERLFKEGVKGGIEDVQSAQALVDEAQALIKVEQTKLAQIRAMTPSSAVRLAEDDVMAKQKQVEKAQLAIDECQVKAPCKGKILRMFINVGELFGPMSKAPAIQFCPSGNRIVRAEVEQEYAGRIHVGQSARVQDDITGTGEWTGKVIGISDWYTQRRAVLLEPMQFNDVRTLEVIVRLDDQGTLPLRINQRVRVKLDGAD